MGDSWWSPVVSWNVLFITINGTWLIMIVYGQRGTRFNDDEQELYETIFPDFTRLDFLKLLRAAVWQNMPTGQRLAVEGRTLEDLILIVRGAVKVSADKKELAAVRDGQFIGEMSYLTEQTASATVTATEPTRCLVWKKDRLRRVLQRNPSLKYGMVKVMGADMSKKLRRVGKTMDQSNLPNKAG